MRHRLPASLALPIPAMPAAVAAAASRTASCSAPGGDSLNVASLPVREELAAGGYLTSLAGYGLTYNTLDNNKRPTSGILVSFGQDFAGLGGDAKYLRTVVDFRSYYEVVSDLVGILHLQGGDMFGLTKGPNWRIATAMCACSTTSRWAPTWSAAFSRPASVRATSPPARPNDALGGTHVLGRQPRSAISVLLPAQGCRLPRRRVRRFRCGMGL